MIQNLQILYKPQRSFYTNIVVLEVVHHSLKMMQKYMWVANKNNKQKFRKQNK